VDILHRHFPDREALFAGVSEHELADGTCGARNVVRRRRLRCEDYPLWTVPLVCERTAVSSSMRAATPASTVKHDVGVKVKELSGVR